MFSAGHLFFLMKLDANTKSLLNTIIEPISSRAMTETWRFCGVHPSC